jgi:hypothetical protein
VKARELQVTIGQPSTKEFIRLVSKNQLPNFLITKVDIAAAEYIFGPDLGTLKGKTVRCASHAVRMSVLKSVN